MSLVSIIVPIYNVEKYLNRCIDSILNQTYKNLEVILVNDGSLDNCRQIIEEYKKLDKRIKIINKENGGLSDARNYGIKIATGDYIFFVDSDDWLDKEGIKILVEKSKEYDADIVQGAYYYTYENYLLYDDRYYKEIDGDVLLDRKNSMKELVINERIKNFAWGKLYKYELIKNIYFEKGVLFEDVFWAHKVFHKSNKFLMVHRPIYYYFQREDSIVGKYSIKNLDILRGLKERYKFIQKNYPELEKNLYKQIVVTSINQYDTMMRFDNSIEARYARKRIKKYINQNMKTIKVMFDDDLDKKIEIEIFSWSYILSRLYRLINRILRKLHLKKSEESLKRIEIR